MIKDFNDTDFLALVSRAGQAFLTDTSYAIAIAKQSGALAARRRAKAEAELAQESVDVF